MNKLCVALVCLLVASPALAVPYSLTHTFDDPTPGFNDDFGFSVSVSGDNVLVGSRLDDTNGIDVGQVHLFNASTGALLRTFNAPTPAGADLFGSSVSVSGDNVLIGAMGDSTNGVSVGQAHLFSAVTGTLLRTFNDPTPTSSDQFGVSVAIDGDNVLIGARLDDTNGVNVGQAYLFSASTGTLLQTFDDPTPSKDSEFGSSVSISGDNVLLGAFLDDTKGENVGQAYLFSASTGTLLQTFDDPTPTDSDQFGVSVAVEGNNVLIGAITDDTIGTNFSQAHLFNATTGALLQTFNNPTPLSNDEFGASVSIDGDNVLIGGRADDTSGANVGQAHLFSATTGALLQSFNDPTVTASDFFGISVSISDNNVVIGAFRDDTNGTNTGQVHLFTTPEEAGGPSVPEPSALALLCVGLLLLRRRP
jgi:hypothetical protein